METGAVRGGVRTEHLISASTPSEIKLQLFHRQVCLSLFNVIVIGWSQTLGHQSEVGLVEDNVVQVLLSFDLLSDGVRHVRDHVRQDELGEVNNVLRREEEQVFRNLFFWCVCVLMRFCAYTYLYNNYKRHFGGDHVPV